MTHLPEEVLAALALGDPEVASADRSHLSSCPTCGADLHELRRVHSLLRDAGADPVELAPDPALWDRIAHATDPGGGEHAAAAHAWAGDEHAPADVVALRRSPTPRTARVERGWARRWRLAAAALVCVLAGLGIGRLVWPTGQPPQRVLATVNLDTLDGSQVLGQAQLLEQAGTTELRISAAAMPDSPGFVEVWLINNDGTRMVSLGVLDAKDEVFAVPPTALAQGYRIVDLSRELYDNEPRHSGDSIMRGTLPA